MTGPDAVLVAMWLLFPWAVVGRAMSHWYRARIHYNCLCQQQPVAPNLYLLSGCLGSKLSAASHLYWSHVVGFGPYKHSITLWGHCSLWWGGCGCFFRLVHTQLLIWTLEFRQVVSYELTQSFVTFPMRVPWRQGLVKLPFHVSVSSSVKWVLQWRVPGRVIVRVTQTYWWFNNPKSRLLNCQ